MEKKTSLEALENIDKNSNILIVGSSLDYSLEKCYFRNFKYLGYNNIEILSLDEKLIFKFFTKFNFSLFRTIYYFICRILIKKLFNKKKYDLVIIFKGMQFDLKTLTYLKKKSSAKWVNIYTDNPFYFKSPTSTNIEVLNCIKFYDLYCLPYKGFVLDRLEKYKVKKKMFLPFGYDPFIHKIQKKISYNKIVNFIGSLDDHRLRIINNIKRYSINFYGNSQLFKKISDHNYYNFIFRKKLSSIIGGSAISINILRNQDTGSHNMKTFEIPAMGGLMLTTRSAEQNDFFPENKGCFMFDGTKELEKKIEYILNNPKIAKKVRIKGIKLSKFHAYYRRIDKILKNINI